MPTNQVNGYWRLLPSVGGTLLLLGMGGFLFGAVVTFTRHAKLWNQFEFPMSAPESIAVDQQGRIFCSLSFYNRIQVYDAQGHFLMTWPSPGHTPLRLRINSSNQLEVADPRRLKSGDHTDMLFTMNEVGALIKSEAIDGIYDSFGSEHDYSARTHTGERYLLKNPWLAPHIVRELDGREITVVRPSLIRWFFGGPFPSWIIFLVGAIMMRNGQRGPELLKNFIDGCKGVLARASAQ